METNIISLAQKIQHYFPKFYLAGGTAIMFKYNHRTSYDLDFFSFKAFSYNRLSQKMTGLFNLGALCSFDDYGDLPQWIKDTLLTLIDPA